LHAIDPDGALVLAAKRNAKRFLVTVALPNGVHAFGADFARWRRWRVHQQHVLVQVCFECHGTDLGAIAEVEISDGNNFDGKMK